MARVSILAITVIKKLKNSWIKVDHSSFLLKMTASEKSLEASLTILTSQVSFTT